MKGDLDQVSFQPPHGAARRWNLTEGEREKGRECARERDGEKDARVPRVCVYQHARPRAARVRHVSVCIRILTGAAGKNGVAAARELPLARADILMPRRTLSEVQLKCR